MSRTIKDRHDLEQPRHDDQQHYADALQRCTGAISVTVTDRGRTVTSSQDVPTQADVDRRRAMLRGILTAPQTHRPSAGTSHFAGPSSTRTLDYTGIAALDFYAGEQD